MMRCFYTVSFLFFFMLSSNAQSTISEENCTNLGGSYEPGWKGLFGWNDGVCGFGSAEWISSEKLESFKTICPRGYELSSSAFSGWVRDFGVVVVRCK